MSLRGLKLFAGKRSALRKRLPATNPDYASVFDPDWYRRTYLADDRNANPFAHFLSRVDPTGCSPNALFDTQWYLERHPEAAANGALRHYLSVGSGDGYSPGPLFDEIWYRTNYADTQPSHLSGLARYLATGKAKGRHTTSWLSDPDGAASPFALSLSANVDRLDLPNISTNYLDPATLHAAAEPLTFFNAQQSRWTATIDGETEPKSSIEVIPAAIAIGGTRQIIRIDAPQPPTRDFSCACRRTWHFLPVKMPLFPVIPNSLHLLGLATAAFPDFVREYLRGQRKSGKIRELTLLVDSNKKNDWQNYIREDPYYRLISVQADIALRLIDTLIIT